MTVTDDMTSTDAYERFQDRIRELKAEIERLRATLLELVQRLEAVDYRFPGKLPFKLTELDESAAAIRALKSNTGG